MFLNYKDMEEENVLLGLKCGNCSIYPQFDKDGDLFYSYIKLL